jgi:hypothetical protein
MADRASHFASSGFRSVVIALLILCSHSAMASQQDAGDSTRGLWDKEFKKARAKARKKSRLPEKNKTEGTRELIGITIWQLREAARGDDRSRPRLLRHKTNTSQLVAERVEIDTPFTEGQMVRLSIEVPRDGFLYVIDREVYADGSLGDPFLIFPTRQMRGGNNSVSAGRVIEIPSQTDDPPYFTLERSRRDQVSERLTIIVSADRLSLPVGSDRQRLDSSLVARWEKQWGGQVQRRDLRGGAGEGWTLAEKESADGRRVLSETDPLPQTIFQIAARPDAPLLLTVPLRIKP